MSDIRKNRKKIEQEKDRKNRKKIEKFGRDVTEMGMKKKAKKIKCRVYTRMWKKCCMFGSKGRGWRGSLSVNGCCKKKRRSS